MAWPEPDGTRPGGDGATGTDVSCLLRLAFISVLLRLPLPSPNGRTLALTEDTRRKDRGLGMTWAGRCGERRREPQEQADHSLTTLQTHPGFDTRISAQAPRTQSRPAHRAELEPTPGFEPGTFSLPRRCSTA